MPSTPPGADTDALPSPLPYGVYARLQARLAEEAAGMARLPEAQVLDDLGQALRSWRLRRGYTRQALARRLQLNPGSLLCVEAGLGRPGDLGQHHLRRLSAEFIDEDPARTLAAALQRYLAALNRNP